MADGQKFSEPSTWVTGRNIEAQYPRHGRASMANDSEVTLWEDKKTTTSQFRTDDCLGSRIRAHLGMMVQDHNRLVRQSLGPGPKTGEDGPGPTTP